jgi:hypothetical protein
MKNKRGSRSLILVAAPTIAALIAISPSITIADGSSFSVKSVKGSYGCRSLASFVNVPISTFGSQLIHLGFHSFC